MGLLVSALAWVLLLQIALGSQVVGQYNLMLDPGRIYWWRSKWVANPIDLSKSNAGTVGVYITFNFSPSTSLSSGVFEVTLPASFTTTGISGSKYKVTSSSVQLLGVSYTAGLDTSLTIGPIGLPSTSGAYGPFALRSRFHSSGQVIDCNLSFASVFLPPADLKMQTASVAFVSSSSYVINRSGNTLSFRFSLSKDLWKHDLFKVTVDKAFTVVTNTDFMCYSVASAGYINNFNGTRASQPALLDCVASEKQSDSLQVVYVYGLGPDLIDASVKDNNLVDIRIPGFTNPYKVGESTSYLWSVETVRFGTTNTLESATFSGPTISADSLIAASWKSSWGISTQNIVNGLQFSMDFSVTLRNPLPSNGVIEITTSETLTGCTVLSYIGLGTTCAVSSGVITVTGFDEMKAGAVAMVASKVTITTSAGKTASLKSIITKWSDGSLVDQATEVGVFTVPSTTTVSAMPTFLMAMWDYKTGAVSDTAGGSGTTGQFINFEADFTTIAAASLTLFFPFTSTVQDFQVCIPTTAPTVYVHTAALTGAPGTGTLVTNVRKTDGSMSRSEGGIPSYVAGEISFLNPISAGAVYIAVYSTSSAIRLQQVAGSYEIRIEAKSTDGRTLIGVSSQLVNSASASVSANFLCSNIDLPGSPLKVTFLPAGLDFPASTSAKTYYLKIGLPTNRFPDLHGSKVGGKGAYPVDTSASSGASMVVDVVGTQLNHYVFGLGNVATTGSGVDVFFPVTYSYTSYTIFSVNVNSCFTLTAEKLNTKTEYCVHSGSVIVPAGAATTATDPVGVPTITGGGALVTGTTSTAQNPMTITLKLTAAITADAYFYISLPRGFKFSPLKDVQSSNPTTGSSFPEKRYFSSPSPSFPFPGVLVKQSYSGTQVSSLASTTLSIYGLIAPLGSYTSSATFMHGDLGAVSTNPCAYKSSSGLGMSVGKGTISTLVVSPSVVFGQGPKGVDLSHSVQMTLPHGIDQGGMVVVTIDSAWTYTLGVSTCTVSGLNIDVVGTDMCTVSSSTIKITNFKDFSSVTNQVVTIYLSRLLPPIALATSATYQFVKTVQTITSTNIANPAVVIDEYGSSTGALVTVNVGITPGVGTFQTISVFPPNAGTTDSDLYLQFTLPYDLPVDSIISISVPYTAITTGIGQNRCWVSPLTYSGCTVSNTISVTIAQNYVALSTVEFFVRHALSPPSDVPAAASKTQYPFKITATWLGATIISDSGTTYVASQLVTPANKVTAQITFNTPAISFSPQNAGESATYTISFKLSVALANTDILYLIWPDEFDPYIGDAVEMLTQDPGNYYLPCTSSQLGTPTWCTVDHWVMVVKGNAALAAGSQVDLVVTQVRNPGEGTTSNFRVFHYDKDLKLAEYATTIGSVTIASLPAAIQIRQLSVSYPYLGSAADYSLLIYAPFSFDSATNLQLQFPKEYDLALIDQLNSYTCATQWVDTTPGTKITTPQDWNSAATCSQANSLVTMSPPSIAKVFSSTSYITWNITAVGNPVWGYTRSKVNAVTDLDIQDWDVWTVYSYWTSKFTVFVYWGSTGNLKYLGKSYGHTTSAYLGFMESKRTILINSYNPRDKSNRIVLWPGTQSTDLTITTANSTVPLEAKSLTFAASTNVRTPDNNALKYTSRLHNFVMLQEEWLINFRVAASIDAVKGLYYIDWKLTESKQPGVTSEIYRKPPPTLVEIAPKIVPRYWFSISSVPTITVGGSSLPIKVSISNPPHTQVVITIAPSLASVTANPASLTFLPDVDELYFYLLVNATHDVAVFPSVIVSFTLTGTDADAFAIQPAIVVGVQSKSLYSTGSITKLGISSATRTTVSISPATDQLGVLYYLLQPRGAKILQFAEVKALARPFVLTEAELAAEMLNNAQKRTDFEADPQEGETWEDFQTRLYLTHVRSFQVCGAVAMVTTVMTTPITIAGLYADTSYQIIAYFDNYQSETEVASRIEYFDTLSVPECQPIYVRFQYTVNETLTDTVMNVLAKHLGINPKRMVDRSHALEKYIYRELIGTGTSGTSNVAFSVFSATILPSRSAELPTPTTISNLTNEAVDRMQSDFQAVSILNKMWNYGPLAIPTRQQPLWSRTPQIQHFSNVSIVVELLSTVLGQSCCVALLDTNPMLKPEQVYHLSDYNWTRAIGECVASNITESINYVSLQDLQPDTNYFIHCVAVDQYPLYPTQMTYSSSLPIPFIPLHTVVDLEVRFELEWGRIIELGFAAFFLY